MGFCLFNNAAIGAAAASPRRGEKVAIVDWDVHHGNGTQDIFYDDPRVLYVSTHESPLYPGTGLLRETRRAARARARTSTCRSRPARRATPTGAAFDEVVVPVVERFAPDWLHHLGRLRRPPQRPARRPAPHAAPTTPTSPCSSRASSGPAASLVVLEGGYDLEALTYSTGAVLSALVGERYRPEEASTGEIGLPTVTAAKQLWGL